MNQDDMNFIVHRDVLDRRSGKQSAPPYLTEEGMVLIDRRSGKDRRVEARKADVINADITNMTSAAHGYAK